MNKLSTYQQQFGDLNRQLNRMRAQMNRDVRAQCNSLLEQKRALEGGEHE
ncbi:TPA: hypothetical protein HA238_00420 [Candidatus Micrarchaeota archaeon]|nr:hypothetical protein [Candidatus Micrarchaeota archaeon]